MGKARAGRRDQKHVKRDVAKESRPTKFANQKGGKIQKARRSNPAAAADEAPMAVIRNGKAVWSGSSETAEPEPQDGAADEPEETREERFTRAEKKLRALRKKLRHLHDVKDRRRRGEELEGAQLALLRGEAALLKDIKRFEAEVAGGESDEEDAIDEMEEAAVEEEEEEEEAEAASALDVPSGESPGKLSLEQRRAKKRARHDARLQEKLRKKEERKKKN